MKQSRFTEEQIIAVLTEHQELATSVIWSPKSCEVPAVLVKPTSRKSIKDRAASDLRRDRHADAFVGEDNDQVRILLRGDAFEEFPQGPRKPHRVSKAIISRHPLPPEPAVDLHFDAGCQREPPAQRETG